ncbi:MAG: translocation/assembly module TamB domain-containing protein [Vicinamibacterales bacterium]
MLRLAVLALAAPILALVVLHTPYARGRVLAVAVDRLGSDFGITAEVDRLDYNLTTLRLTLGATTLTAAGADTPFLTFERATVDLPWAIVGGRLGVESLEVVRPVVTVHTTAEQSNLPAATAATPAEAEPAAPLGAIAVGALAIRHLDVRYTDESAGVAVEGRDLSLVIAGGGLGPAAGRLWMDGGLRLSTAGRSAALTRLDGGLTFDGETVTVEALTLQAAEGRLRLDGAMDPLAAEPRLTARYEGRVDVAAVAGWVGDGLEVGGTVDLSGGIEGPIAATVATLDARAGDLAWRELRGVTLALQARLTPDTASVEGLRVGIAGGSIDGRADVALADDGASRAEVSWARLDLGHLARSASPTAPRLDTRADGRFRATWRGTAVDRATAALDTRLSPGGREGAGPGLSGQLSATLEDSRWSATLDRLALGTTRLAGAVAGRVDGDDPAATTLTGRLTGAVDDLPALLAALEAADIATASPLLVAGQGQAAVDLGGTVAAPSARVTLEVSDLVVADAPAGTLAVAASFEDGRLVVDPAELEIAGNRLRARAGLVVESGQLSGRLDAELDDLSSLAAGFAPDAGIGGRAAIEAALGGTLEAPAITATGHASDLRAGGQRFDEVQLAARLTGGVIDLQRFEVTQGSGRLDAAGTYGLDSGRYAFTLAGRALSLYPVMSGDAPLPIAAGFDLDASGDGTLEAPRAQGTLAVRDLTWGEYRIGAVRFDATTVGERVEVRGEVPALAATLDAAAEIAAPNKFRATLAMAGTRIDAVSRADGPAATTPPPADAVPVTGTVTATLTAAGALDAPAEAAVEIALALADVSAAGVPLVLDGPVHVRYDAGRVAVDRMVLRTGATTLTAAGRFGGSGEGDEPLTVTLDGQAADALPFAHLVPGLEALDASGSVDLRLTAAGTLDAPRLTATAAVQDLTVAVPGMPPMSGGTLQASFDRGLLTLTGLTATWQGATLQAAGRAPVTLLGDHLPEGYRRTLPDLPDRATATIRAESLTTRLAEPFVDAETLRQIEMAASARIEVEATASTPDAVQAAVVLDQASFVLAGQKLAQTTPTTLRLAEGRLDVAAWDWRGGTNRLSITGGATPWGERPEIAAAVGGTLDLRMLGAVAPDVTAGGQARFDIRAAGPLDDPTLDGEIVVSGGELALREPRVALTDLTGRIALARDRVRLEDLRASANGGTLAASGEVVLDAFAPTGGSVTIEGRGLALEAPEHLRSELDLDLALGLSADDPRLSGRITILRGAYRSPISLASQLLAGVEVEAAAPPEPGLLDRLRLDVDVVSEEGIVVDNNYGRLDVGTDLKVIGTAAQPALAGRMAFAEGGAVFLAGQTWAIERGTVDFTNAATIEPTFNLSLTTRVQQYDVRLTVTGTPAVLEANLSSPDGISQADAISLLLTGSLADQQTVAQRDIARGQLVLLLSGELLGFAGRAVGLDSVQVGRGLGAAGSSFDLLATDSDPANRLTLSKRLRRDVELVFSRSLGDANDITWIAIYRPFRAVELRTTTLDDNARSYEFRHEITFGGRPAVRTETPRAVSPRVAAVELRGDRGASDDELRGRLRLSEGDRFDFYRWQQDRDRLSDFYHQRGRFEARVRATREPTTDRQGRPAVVLGYAIDQGPETSVVVNGPALPGGVLDDIRESWADAVFDGFLRDDSEALVRQALAGDGYLQATVETEMRQDAAAGTKTLVLHVEPGVRFTDRSLRFQGQQAVTAEALTGVLDARRLRVAAWLRPGEAETALEAHYRTLGYAGAEVSIGQPQFAGTTATLPVVVDEGPQFRVGTVEIRGVATRPLDQVRDRFGIAAGAVFLPTALEAARREVELAYASEGFNDARAIVTSRIAGDAEVAVELEVREGPRQVLEDVVVRGRVRTTAGTVEEALDLERGAPADRADTYRAQKRLFDTGVFRRADIDLEPLGPPADDGTQPVRAAVTLEEIPPYRFRYGLRITDDTGPFEADRTLRPGVVADLLRRNLFGRAFSAGLAGQLEADRRLARAIFSAPRLFGLPVTSNLFLTRSRQDFTTPGTTPFVRDGAELVAEQRFNPRPDMTVSYNYRFLRTHAFQIGPDADGLFDLRVDVARLTGNFAWDGRDDPFNPRRGGFHSSGIEFATPSLGSDIRFMKFVLQQYQFVPVGPVVLASAFRLGTAWAFDPPLLLTERYFAGGGTSVRGYAEDALGGVDVLGSPAGGANSLVLNQEVRFPIYKWARGVGFVDAGNLFPRVRDIALRDLAYGAGVGLRLETPFGLARIDFGVPLTDRQRQPAGRWYFSIGHAF